MDKISPNKKYVAVLAHADGWGAVSANKLIKSLHKEHPDIGVHLIVSKASRSQKTGKILTKEKDLEIPRELKETKLLEYFDRIDELIDATPTSEEIQRKVADGNATVEWMFNAGKMQGMTSYEHPYDTFKQLAKKYCADGAVHYTTKGGPGGGEEAAQIIDQLEQQHDGQEPEVLLSVDTMAILPERTLRKYQCFSAHPGPLDTIKVEGMQATLRSLVEQVLYDADGKPLPSDYVMIPDVSPILTATTQQHSAALNMGAAHLKGTLFMQLPELDKGPLVATTLSKIYAGQSAYEARDLVYNDLVNQMIKKLPVLLDREKRTELIKQITEKKEALDKHPHTKVPELDAEKFATWQGSVIAVANGMPPWGLEVVQNQIVDPRHFKNRMLHFSPLPYDTFEKLYDEVFSANIAALEKQQDAHLNDPWARIFSGRDEMLTRTVYDPKTGQPLYTHEFATNPETGQPTITDVDIVSGERRDITQEY